MTSILGLPESSRVCTAPTAPAKCRDCAAPPVSSTCPAVVHCRALQYSIVSLSICATTHCYVRREMPGRGAQRNGGLRQRHSGMLVAGCQTSHSPADLTCTWPTRPGQLRALSIGIRGDERAAGAGRPAVRCAWHARFDAVSMRQQAYTLAASLPYHNRRPKRKAQRAPRARSALPAPAANPDTNPLCSPTRKQGCGPGLGELGACSSHGERGSWVLGAALVLPLLPTAARML